MKETKETRLLPALAYTCFALALVAFPVTAAFAQNVRGGTIEGRVLNADTGEYLGNARLTVEGTSLETFTDAEGNFRLTNVPLGTARVRTFYTGLPARVEEVAVTAGPPAQLAVSLSASATTPAGPKSAGAVVKLDEFVVATSREMEGAALAINEQRFASNIKNVVSTEEFGNVAEGNPAEFLKFLPGISIDYTGGNARDISINGVPRTMCRSRSADSAWRRPRQT